MKTIEIDCAPCTPRPNTYLPGVLEGTGIPIKDHIGAFFGNFTWDYSEIPDDVWEKAKPVIGERIKKLHSDGFIRYGSW